MATVETGTVTVFGNQVTTIPAFPEGPPLVGVWSFQGDSLVLDWDSEFDFNQDAETEARLANILLEPVDL